MTKQITVLMLLLLIPIFLMSSVHNHRAFSKSHQYNGVKSMDRAWRLTEVLSEDFYNGTYSFDEKTVPVYNTSHPSKIDTLKNYRYYNDMWELSWKDVHTYDNTGQYITLVMSYDYYNGEESVYRTLLQYDNQHRLIKLTEEDYNQDALNWTLSYQTTINYNTNSVNSIISYNPPYDTDPAYWDRSIFTNDTQGRMIMETNQTSADSSIWVEDYRTTYTYHTSDTSTGEDFIDALAHVYENPDGMEEGPYQLLGMVSESTEQSFEDTWVNDYKVIFTYDVLGMITEIVEQNWDSDWENSHQTLVTYNVDGNKDQAVHNNWLSVDWDLSGRDTYTWGQFTANEDNTNLAVSAVNITSSPNPFYNNMFIKVNSKSVQPVKISVFNTKGQLINTLNAKSNTDILWNGKDMHNQAVSNGIYFIKAEIGSYSKTSKILKLK